MSNFILHFRYLLYLVIALFGYIAFASLGGENVADNIISMYPEAHAAIMAGKVCIVLVVLLSIPLLVHPCRTSIDKIVGKIMKRPSDDIPGMPRYLITTSSILGSMWFVAFLVSDLSVVLGFLGAT
jgi:amino acid permease